MLYSSSFSRREPATATLTPLVGSVMIEPGSPWENGDCKEIFGLKRSRPETVSWTWYDQYVVRPHPKANLHQFFNSVEHPIALMCVEIDPLECHSHRLFLALEHMGFKGFDL